MGGKSDIDLPEPPPLPDPEDIIGRQLDVNRINQTTPFGSLTFGGPNRSDLRFTLSPELQALFQTQTGFGNLAGQQGLGLLQNANFQPFDVQSGQEAADALFQLGSGRLTPEFQRRRDRIQNQLENLGNPATGADLSPMAVSELSLLGEQENDALNRLALQAALAGPQFAGANLQNQMAAQGGTIQNALALGGGSPIGVPQFNFAGPSPIDVTSAFGIPTNAGANMGIARAELASQNRSDMFGGLFDLGSSLITGGFSGNPFSLF